MRFGPRQAWIVVAGIWCLLAARFYRAFVSEDAWGMSDDVYISACAARSLIEGYGPVWFPDAPRVEGFSNPLWVGVLALLHWLPGFSDDRLGGLVLAVNLGLFVALAGACARLLAGLSFGRWWILAVFSLGGAALPYFAAEGFEVVLIALLGVLALDAARREQPMHFALWVGLGFWTRMDFLIMAALPGAWLGARLRGDPRVPRALLVGASLAALLFAARWSFFGEWLPNTVYLKTVGWPIVDRVARGLVQNAWAWPSALLLLGMVGLAARRERAVGAGAGAQQGFALGCVAVFVVGLSYSTYLGGDFMPRRAGWDRFTAPYLPLLLVGLSASLGALRTTPTRRAAAVGLTLLVLLAPAVATDADRKVLDRRLVNFEIGAEPQKWSRGWRSFGRAYGDVSLPGARMAVCSAGSVVYFSHRGGVDLLGKLDPVVARLPVTGRPDEARCWRDWPGHNKEAIEISFELYRPDFSAVPPPRAFRDQYRPVRYGGHEFWARRGSEYVVWDLL